MAQVGNYHDAFFLLFRELCFHLEGTDAFHLIAEKVYTEGIFGREGKDVDNTATNGILPRLVDVVHIFETVAAQYVRHEVHIHPLACMQFQCILSQFLTRDHLFGQRIRIGHHAKPLFSFCRRLSTSVRSISFAASFCPYLMARRNEEGKTIPALSPISASNHDRNNRLPPYRPE